MDDPATMTAASLDLYWIPLGAGSPVVRFSGWVYEGLSARRQRRPRCALYHSALVATLDDVPTYIEMTPVPDANGRVARGVVAEGPVGLRSARRLRMFRYEIRRWAGGMIPDISFAVGAPLRLTEAVTDVRRVLDAVPGVPTLVWGRDALGVGDMWNSNSVIAWVLASAGLYEVAEGPPAGGRAPGWRAGWVAAGGPSPLSAVALAP